MRYFRHLKQDIQAVLDRDPAARNAFEVWVCYTGFRAVRSYRRAHAFWTHGFKTIGRMISQRCARHTGIEIHPAAQIGESLFIDHGHGVVIGETSIIGDNVTLYQGVTLGGTGKDVGKRHPTIGNNVMIGAGAKLLGPLTIGDNCKIGAGAVVLKDVPPNCTVVGIPGRIVRRNAEPITGPDLNQIDLPDPVSDKLLELSQTVENLQHIVDLLESNQHDVQ